MINVTRLGNGWATAIDPATQEAIVIHLDSLRQELTDPLNPAAVVASFSYYRRAQPGEEEVINPTAADLKAATVYKDADGNKELVLLMGFNDGLNPANLFNTVMFVLFNVVLGNHGPMSYPEYQDYLKTNPRNGKTYLAKENPSSPTGRFAVWKVLFTRYYGIDSNGLFAKLKAEATYRFGCMGGQEVFPGHMYNFPANFILTRPIEGTDFISVLSNLLSAASQSEDLAKVEPYYVK